MSEDLRLLRQYREQGSEAAFARLAARHLNFVYATCLRETGDAALAEDAAQVVFLLLARKAPALCPGRSLSGWLFGTARFVARNARRRESRRKAWEERAIEQTPSIGPAEDALWDRLGPAVNDALASLGAKDREAVLLRFADGLSFPELGTALGTPEDAARMRLNRAIDRLRRFFAKEGVTLSGAALIGLLADHTVQAAPVGLAEAMSQPSPQFAAGPQAQLLYRGALTTMRMMKLKVAMLTCGAGLVVAVTGLGIAKTTAFPGETQSARKAIEHILPPKLPKLRKGTHMNTSATVVQNYLDACSVKKYEEAYQLLAPTTRQQISLDFFQQRKQLPADPAADGMTPTLTAVSSFFIDSVNPNGYRYTVVGVSPKDPSLVLVQTQPSGAVSTAILHLKIVTVRVSPSQIPLIDMMQSYQLTDPSGFKQMEKWAEDRARK